MSVTQSYSILSDPFPTSRDDPIIPFSTKPGIPQNGVGLITYLEDQHHLSYYLSYNHHEVMIQTPKTIEGVDDRNKDAVFVHWLEVIQSVLNTVQWEKSNRAVLIKSKKRGYVVESMRPVTRFRLETYASLPFQMPPCPPWAPMIPDEEIVYTVYGERQASERRGIWKGHRLDIHYAWDDYSYYTLNRTMWSHRMLEGRTPQVLAGVVGHIKNSAGNIIGIATEANEGRAITCSDEDRAKVYEAVAAIQNWGFIYSPCLENKFMIIDDGSVRFTEVHCLLYIPDRVTRERKAEKTHWAALDELFFELQNPFWGRYGWFRFPPSRLTTDPRHHRYIPPPISPERPMGGIFFMTPFFHEFYHPLWPGYELNHAKLRPVIPEHEWMYIIREVRKKEPLYKRYVLGVINAEDDVLEEMSIIPSYLFRCNAAALTSGSTGHSTDLASNASADLIMTGYHPSDQRMFVGDFDSDGRPLHRSLSSSRHIKGKRSLGHHSGSEDGHSSPGQLRRRSQRSSPPSFHPYLAPSRTTRQVDSGF
ncbi:hypothetical protein CVT24_010087 [Panaeolus cyanescens]|uniref:Uncharacterized protein n=1 Tax=Panaeolus cyanescens TaxID=181874 RepID=A0A409YQ24_9AGAR|nr:hypothetical protein CVT24_010087 [Panaeolus cyanescens]